MTAVQEREAAMRIHLAAALDSLHRARALAEVNAALGGDTRPVMAVFGALHETIEARRAIQSRP